MEQKQYTVLIYRHFFQTEQLPAKNLNSITGLNRDNVFRFLIQIKVAVTKTQEKNIEHPFIHLLLRDLPPAYAQRLSVMLNQENQAYFLTHPVVIDQILAEILNEGAGTDDPGKNNVKYFAGALLELLMIYNDHHFRTLNIGKRPDNHDLIWEMMQMQNINGNNPTSFVRCGIIKQVIFIEFLKDYLGDQYQAFDQEMAGMIGIAALGNSALMYVQLQAVQDKVGMTNRPIVLVGPDDEIYPVIHQLQLVIDVNNREGLYDAGRVISHPFLKLSDGNLYLTGTHNFSLITDKVWEYFLFSTGKISKFIPGIKRPNDLFSFIGLHYIEKFLLTKLYGTLERSGCRLVLSDDQFTPDLTLIVNETDVFIFEIKSASLHYKVWQDQDLPAFKKYLDEQYIRGKKGVIQLHKCLKNLTEQPEQLFGLRKPLRKLKIYPIIIFTEPHLTIAGVNDYMIENSPELVPTVAANFQHVAPLTLIHYDFFVENIYLLQEKRALLKEAIIKYHQVVNARKAQHRKVNTTSNYIKAMQSFDNFIAGFQGLYDLRQDKVANELAAIFDPRRQHKGDA